jgi:hypothetical protein
LLGDRAGAVAAAACGAGTAAARAEDHRGDEAGDERARRGEARVEAAHVVVGDGLPRGAGHRVMVLSQRHSGLQCVERISDRLQAPACVSGRSRLAAES